MIKRWVASLSLRQKLVGAMMMTSISVMLILGGYVWFDETTGFRTRIGDRLVALAEVTAQNSEAAILFGDPNAAIITLSALKAQPDIISALIFTPSKKVFAKYYSNNRRSSEAKKREAYPNRPAGLYFDPDQVQVIRPIVVDKESIGILVIQSSKEELETLALRGLIAALFVCAIALSGAFFIASWLERLINHPVRSLANTANEIGQSGNYSVRAKKNTSDEIGMLVDQFNTMLGRIETHNGQLAEQLTLRTEERTFLQNIIDAVDDAIMVIAPDFSVELMNRSARGFITIELPSTVLCYQARYGYSQPCHEMGHRCPFVDLATEIRPIVLEREIYRTIGQPRYLEISASPLINGNGQLSGIVEAVKDITERKNSELKLIENKSRFDYLAHHDFLTDLPNRLFFHERLLRVIDQSNQRSTRFALLFLDLDRFKNVNDSFGHEIGDDLLKSAARRIQHTLRKSDFIARLGGDEFAIILYSIDSTELVTQIANKIIRSLDSHFMIDSHEIYIGVSIGMAIYPIDGADFETLTKNADTAMYQAKEQGRGNAKFYLAGTNEKIHRVVSIEQNMRAALERNEFQLYYQPQVDIANAKIVSAEALLRWNNPELGWISPGEFIPIAEDCGLIVQIGEWVIRSACHQVAAWDAAGLPAINIGINLSPRQFWQPNLIDMVMQYLQESGLPANRMDIELTEGMVLKDASEAIELMRKLRALGLKLSIDDFGTGYSSLSYLHRLPIDNLKIAQEFVREIPQDANSVVIARQIVMLAKGLNLKIIVEGVETQQQNEFFSALGCELVQGYYFSRPLPAEEFAKLLAAPLTVSAQ